MSYSPEYGSIALLGIFKHFEPNFTQGARTSAKLALKIKVRNPQQIICFWKDLSLQNIEL